MDIVIEEKCANKKESIEQTNRDEIINIIKNMKNVGSGFDKINARIFKLTYLAIIDKIVHFINICLIHGKFPSMLKIAVIKPIYKSGDKSLMNNYRPISLLPFISKILEKVIHTRLNDHIRDNNLLTSNQFGFQKGLSTYMPLLKLQDMVINGFENNMLTCGIYLDLKKAFDTVDHSILLNKLKAYGISGTFIDMITSYLSNRFQCVEFSAIRSTLQPIKIGVPQGSILGPLLFILFVNDFPEVSTKFTSLLYADDTAILFQSKTNEALQHLLNEELPKVDQWFKLNKLLLNTDKTYYQLYNTTKQHISLDVRIKDATIKHADTVKYLGVFIDKDMKWNSHIISLSHIISRNIGIIYRSKHFLTNNYRLLLYNSLVLPYLNYCCLLWGYSTKSSINKLFVLQKKAVRLVDNQPKLAHSSQIFAKLNLLKLEDIAKQQTLVLLYNIITHNSPPTITSLFERTRFTPQNTRILRHFSEKFTRKTYGTRTISWVGPRIWNNMVTPHYPNPESITTSKMQFKKMIKQLMIAEY